MYNVSFKSTIRPTSVDDYNKTVPRDEKFYVAPPWTFNESVCDTKAYTKNVLDCVVCGITDGVKVLLLHICPTNDNNQDFSKIIKFIKDKIDLNNPDLQAILVGSQPPRNGDNRSNILWDNFANFLNKYKIPFSQFKGGEGEKHVAYSSVKDEWVIASTKYDGSLTSQNALNQMFDDVFISSADDLD